MQPPRTWFTKDQAARFLQSDRGLPFAAFALGLLLYGVGLAQPGFFVVDEEIYCGAGRELTQRPLLGDEAHPDWRGLPANFEHPPMGKLWMWASQELFGNSLAACRLPSLVAGAAIGATLFIGGLRTSKNVLVGVAACTFWFMDNLAYFGSTYAMLDVPATAFAIGAYAAALHPQRHPAWAGLLFGLAVAHKLSALFVGPVLAWVIWRRLRTLPQGSRTPRILVTLIASAAAFCFSYLPYLALWTRLDGPLAAIGTFSKTLASMVAYHSGSGYFLGLNPGPLQWFVPTTTPIGEVVFRSDGTVQIAVALGNLLLWWSILIGSAALLVKTWRNYNRGGTLSELERHFLHTVLALVAAFLPYLLLSRRVYAFYAIGYLPFLNLLGGILFALAVANPKLRRPVIALAVTSAVFFLLRLPLVAGIPIPTWYAGALMPNFGQ